MKANAVSEPIHSIFGLRAASRLMLDVIPPWTQELGLLIESIEAVRPVAVSCSRTPKLSERQLN